MCPGQFELNKFDLQTNLFDLQTNLFFMSLGNYAALLVIAYVCNAIP